MSSEGLAIARPDANVHRIAGRYRVESQIAAGGMAIVYAVLDESTGARVALKRLKEQHAGEDSAALFEREYHTLRRLRHPTIVEVYDYGFVDRTPYYTMELLEGQNLYEIAPLAYRDACRHLRDVAQSLALLHARRLVHRDVSARNVVRTPSGRCKLLDFGGLVPFGVSTQVVGTPPFTAPEVLSGVPLDQRIDLYSLGALGYWLLTRQHAFAVRRFSELFKASRERPQPPSALVPGIPPALDELLLSLLSDKPLARPSTAAEVIDRLTLIGELEPEHDIGVAFSYLASPALSGRSSELAEIRAALGQAQRGRGGLVLVEGGSGMGKTRLLTEIVIEAQTSGAIVVQIDASMHRESLGVATALALRLLDAAPEEASRAAPPYGGYLARLSHALHVRLDATERMAGPGEKDWRGRVQEALQGWLLAVSERRTVVLAIDDAQYADTGSLALLAALGLEARRHALLVVASVSSGAQTSPTPELVRSHTGLVRLKALSSADTEELVRSLFGNVPNVSRLSEWLHDASSGNPLCVVELARKLVSDQFVRYAEGTWVVPQEPPHEPLPRSVQDAARARLAELGPNSRALAEALSLSRGPIPVAMCGLVASDAGLKNPFDALEELVSEGVLQSHGDGYRFGQDSLRQELADSLPADRRARLHRRIGEWLLERAAHDPAVRIEAGWQLLHGGEERRGADLLARQAVTLRTLNVFEGDMPSTTPAIEVALGVYKKEKRSVYEIIPLLFALTICGYFFDRRLAERYGDETIKVLERACGLRLARRLRPFVGGFLAISLGLGIAWIRFRMRRPRGLAYGFDLLVTYCVGAVACVCGVATVSLDPRRAAEVAEVLEPFAALGNRRTTPVIYRYCQALAKMATEELDSVTKTLLELDRTFDDPKQVTLLSDDARRVMRGGVLYMLGVRECFRGRATALGYAQRLEALNVKTYEMVADQLRATYHAFRGEMAIAEKWRARVELHGIQLGCSWQADLWWPVCKLHVAATFGDVGALKNCVEQFDQLSQELPSLSRYGVFARAAHALWLGDFGRAAELSQAIEQEQPKSFMGWIAAVGIRSVILSCNGEPDRAARLADWALSHFSEADRKYLPLTIAAEVELPTAQAASGNLHWAVQRLDWLLEQCSTLDNPMVNAWVHRARARVALMAGDDASFELHLTEMQRWAQLTEYPALIAQCEALAAHGRRGSARPQIGESTEPLSLQAAAGSKPEEKPEEMTATTAAGGGTSESVTTAVDAVETGMYRR